MLTGFRPTRGFAWDCEPADEAYRRRSGWGGRYVPKVTRTEKIGFRVYMVNVDALQ